MAGKHKNDRQTFSMECLRRFIEFEREKKKLKSKMIDGGDTY